MGVWVDFDTSGRVGHMRAGARVAEPSGTWGTSARDVATPVTQLGLYPAPARSLQGFWCLRSVSRL